MDLVRERSFYDQSSTPEKSPRFWGLVVYKFDTPFYDRRLALHLRMIEQDDIQMPGWTSGLIAKAIHPTDAYRNGSDTAMRMFAGHYCKSSSCCRSHHVVRNLAGRFWFLLMSLLLDRKLTSADVFKDELLARGEWVVACVDPKICWPMSVEKIAYRGQQLYVVPQFDDYYPSLAVMRGPGLPTFESAQLLLLNFISAKCWLEGQGCDVSHWTGGNLPRPMAGFARSGVQLIRTLHYDAFDIPDAADQKARWALAFYREGLSIRQVSYAFLSFYKIINILHGPGRDQKTWINGKIDAAAEIERMTAKPRLEALRKSGVDVGEYLYESGRCAVAHAGHGVTVDPEDPADLRRLADDLPLVKAMAAYGIEREFGIKSSRTLYDEHLYELRAFREHFGVALIARLKAGESPDITVYPALPNLTFGLHRQEPFAPLTNMTANIVASENGCVLVECTHVSGRTRMFVWLVFIEERLGCDVFDGLESVDDGSAAAAVDAAAVMRFRRHYFANGQLIVRNAETGAIWGRCDAFMPVNVDMGRTLDGMDAAIAKLEADAVARGRG